MGVWFATRGSAFPGIQILANSRELLMVKTPARQVLTALRSVHADLGKQKEAE
jgi:hypothetical protein